MSKWKPIQVTITFVFAGSATYKFGLGDDNRLYEWNYDTGKWLKYWNWEEDE